MTDLLRRDRMRLYRKKWEHTHWENRLRNNAKRNARYKGRSFNILANKMKQNATKGQLISFAKGVLNVFNAELGV